MQIDNSEIIPIDMSQAHLWLIAPERVTDADLLSSLFEFLSFEERLQQNKYLFKKDRHQYLVAHAFLRLCLSQYIDVKSDQWTFHKNRYGKPYTDCLINGLPLKFNLSHTNGLVACIITVQHEVGVDVEYVVRDETRREIAERYFSPEEYHDMSLLSPEGQDKKFYDYWTLKEAYIKAIGRGLYMPLDAFFFKFEDNSRIKISFRDTVNNQSDQWIFYLHELEQKFMCAVAIECGDVSVELVMKGAVALSTAWNHIIDNSNL